jgi:hypothetical protein
VDLPSRSAPRISEKDGGDQAGQGARVKNEGGGVLKVNALIFGWNSASIEFFSKSGYLVADMKEAQKSLVAGKR